MIDNMAKYDVSLIVLDLQWSNTAGTVDSMASIPYLPEPMPWVSCGLLTSLIIKLATANYMMPSILRSYTTD
jgi:hypothetical protein